VNLLVEEDQLPASSYTPLEMELLDRQQIDAWLDSISGRLQKVKRDFAILYPQFSILVLPPPA
jgi:hypothetical protein